ncbi:hypothetical protein [Archangium sp. Cb G35]|uniref:hypothetical protein n=1 Tax=Archangium sp. Cb G35 TaxID=1920190 RepID=UPI000AE989D8|nr:hypothetical protein [Archangium sp. Cb G35]
MEGTHVEGSQHRVLTAAPRITLGWIKANQSTPIRSEAKANDFRVVDTGDAFKGTGWNRIDICTANATVSCEATINGRLSIELQ